MNSQLRVLAALIFLAALSACGQSGPLYIPGNPSTVQTPAEQPAAEDADEDDDDESP
jgi:predicted small lipoprotein YifL